MTVFFRRLSAALVAVSMLGVFGADEAFAQRSVVAPAGGVSSTTAPSNGEGTPSGGSGNLTTTRVGPSGVSPMAGAGVAPAAASTYAAPRRHRARHHRRHRAARSAAQSN